MILAIPHTETNESASEEQAEEEPTTEDLFPEGIDPELDIIIFCYDTNLKAWYTFTPEDITELPLHIFPIDYKGATEGIGLIFPDKITMIPLTGEYSGELPIYDSSGTVDTEGYYPIRVETGELSLSSPPVGTSHVCQLEFDFDWFIGEMDIRVEGYDYYGRHICIQKHISEPSMQRDYLAWVRIDQKMRTFNVTMTGVCRFRLYDIIQKVYMQSRKVNLVYGFDDRIAYHGHHGDTVYEVHHYLDNYNNLRRAILP